MKTVLPYLIALVFVVADFGLHMSKHSDSMLNERNHVISNAFLTSQINYHKELPPFARRPLTTWLIESAAKTFSIRLGVAFIWVNFTLVFCSGILLFFLSQKLSISYDGNIGSKVSPPEGENCSYWFSIGNMVIYFVGFSILFAFFTPLFSYDEPLQYTLIFASFLALSHRKWVLNVICFTLALVARETTVILVPALVFFFIDTSRKSIFPISPEFRKKLAFILLPVVLYVLFLVFYLWKMNLWHGTSTEMTDRISCFASNFNDQKSAMESLSSLFLVLGLPLYFLVATLGRKEMNPAYKKYINAFWLTFAINTPIVFLTTFARESRLFALPLFFLWPIFLQIFKREFGLLFSYRLYGPCFMKWQNAVGLLVFGFINYLIAFKAYDSDYTQGPTPYYNWYFFLLLMIITVHFILNGFLERHPENKDQWY
ncbi:hypothetical protein K8352_02935 [Flavobacteriaceae bacterium F89]|uniref:Uncharacterized protein n=1 Tax=Cerina litoralis TaxID=2874477 RepID=A0AAE3EU70_9FLAO|nr:hypothetical protein [Cerina litoralis]MCG2459696.1 hypothetical protein [Cerina litoralis]